MICGEKNGKIDDAWVSFCAAPLSPLKLLRKGQVSQSRQNSAVWSKKELRT
jgi:Zn-finger protein